ncbi:Ferrous iron transport protein B [hydrothermal vent metagenome]|uniref:Ferrous iron transport protein B n=1 Tax=hydrothermal vent metagenome TaxID=652676 RepID=A0A3B0R6Y2_9ZZZZ
MREAKIALVGSPNCGKSSLFNSLTGSRQKVANYPGVTVERRSGKYITAEGQEVTLIDLPGIYSLKDRTLDERVSRQVITGTHKSESRPDILLCVADSTNLRVHLRLVLELKYLGLPVILVLNMQDLAKRDGISIDPEILSQELGLPVVTSVAVRSSSLDSLKKQLSLSIAALTPPKDVTPSPTTRDLQKQARKIAEKAIIAEGTQHKVTRELDKILLHPVFGIIIFFITLFGMFQLVYFWAEAPIALIENGFNILQNYIIQVMPDNWFRSLLVHGVIAGVGSVLVFLPQIIILFTFILTLEATGYMARAAFIMDRLMAMVGLNGRAFIPLMSSFACAIPGIMATRTIEHHRDRITTIMIAPLMTCSARIPVYALLIGAVVPNDPVVYGLFGLQGLVLFSLYLAGIVSALIVATVLKMTLTRGVPQPLLMELPKYQLPVLKHLLMNLWERARFFLKRAGTIILYSAIGLWVLAQYPKKPLGATEPDIFYSFAGILGRGLQHIFEPLGFNWEISIALIPGMAAREVAIGALGTVYALQGNEGQVEQGLRTVIQNSWPLPTAFAFLAWYVYAPQCFATIATVRRETNSLGWTIFMTSYLFALAYLIALMVNKVTIAVMG